jgi:hypothetical protein
MAFENDRLTEKVIGLAIEVHRQLGPDAKVATSSKKTQQA